jgi:hypothetical protein
VEWTKAQKAADNGKYGSARSFKLNLEWSWKKTHTNFGEDKLKKATRSGRNFGCLDYSSIAITIAISVAGLGKRTDLGKSSKNLWDDGLWFGYTKLVKSTLSGGKFGCLD